MKKFIFPKRPSLVEVVFKIRRSSRAVEHAKLATLQPVISRNQLVSNSCFSFELKLKWSRCLLCHLTQSGLEPTYSYNLNNKHGCDWNCRHYAFQILIFLYIISIAENYLSNLRHVATSCILLFSIYVTTLPIL